MRFNTDVVFTDASGQVRSRSGDLTLRTDAPGDVIVASEALRPEVSPGISLGTEALPWEYLHALGASFTSRPQVDGSGVLLQDEVGGEVACYAFNGIAAPFTNTFTPIIWGQNVAQEATFSRAGSVITVHKNGVYEIDLAAHIARTQSPNAIVVESHLVINGSFLTPFQGFGTFYPDQTLPAQAMQIVKHLALALPSGSTIQAGSSVLFGTGAAFHVFGSTLKIRRR